MFLKKLGYILITLVLIFSCVSAVSWRGSDLEGVSDFPSSVIEPTQYFGYEIEREGETVRFEPTVDEPYFQIPVNGDDYPFLILELAEPIDRELRPRLYYSDVNDFNAEHLMVKGTLSADCKTVIFPMREEVPPAYMWVQIPADFTLQSVYGADFSGTPALHFNWIAPVVVLVALGILALTERKFGYFAWLKRTVMHPVDAMKRSLADGKRLVFSLQLLTWTVTLAYLGGVALLLLLGIYTKTTILGAFAGAVLTVALQIAMRTVTQKGCTPAKMFFTVAILIGLLFCYTMPPMLYVSWDDDAHLDNAYDLVHLFDDETPLSENLLFYHRLYTIEQYTAEPESVISAMVNGSETDTVLNATFCHPYNAFAYLPMMLSFGLSALIGADIVKMVILSRIATLLTYSIILYFGIRKLRSGGYIVSAVALIPTAFFMACSNNYDFWLNAWLFFGFCSLLSLLQHPETKIRGGDIAKILVAFFVGLGPKAIYSFMLLPLLFLKTERFESRRLARKCRIWTMAVIGFVLLTIALPGLILPEMYSDTRGGSDVNAGGQIAFILSNPFRYAKILLKFMGEYISVSSMASSGLLYAYLGYSGVFYGTVSVFMLLYCVFTDRREDDAYGSMQRIRWITLLTCFVQVVLVITSLYVAYTPVGLETVNGCQYRYLFPIMVPFCFFLVPKGIRCAINPKFQTAFIYGGLSYALLASFFQSYLVGFTL